MLSEADIKANARAMSNMADAMVGLTRVIAELNKNLKVLADAAKDPLTGECQDYFCGTPVKHDHGFACRGGCGCKKNSV